MVSLKRKPIESSKKSSSALSKGKAPVRPKTSQEEAFARASQKSKALSSKKQLDFLNEDSDGSGYDEAPGGGNDDEVDMDFTSALAGSSKGPVRPPAVVNEDDDEREIMELMGKKVMKDGAKAAKSVVGGKGKGKDVKGVVGGGSWQSMGLAPPLLRSLLMRGYKTPTPIQRASIPSAIATPPRDLVGMARTGSGKTLAYMIPLLQRLQGRPSTKFGARSLILCPGRELAVQILRVGKEMARGFRSGRGGNHAGDDEDPDDEDTERKEGELRWGLVVGGEGLDDQFSMIASNPDVIIATPGRLLHLIVEMNLDLRGVEYVVFDEADRLFEMGFEVQLHEILHRLPPTRQTLLFSATLPKTLVDFAKAGLQNPKLIRLDAETKISSDLRSAFFSVKPSEKEAALLTLLKEVIKVPVEKDGVRGGDGAASDEEDDGGGDSEDENRGKRRVDRKPKKFRRQEKFPNQTAPHQTLIFVATKHHVEYLTTLLRAAGYSTSHIYGSLDQTARKQQMDRFRRGRTNLLVVTDLAARGIDIPVLENVVNYDFPAGARVFVHRVGRTARAGRKGWAWSFVTNPELPFLLDLQLFLGRPLVNARTWTGAADEYVSSLLLGSLPRDFVDAEVEYINTTLTESSPNLPILREVTRRGQAMYERSQGKASQESYRRAKGMTKDPQWGLAGSPGEAASIHPIFAEIAGTTPSALNHVDRDMESARAELLAKVSNFTPQETVFEVGTRGKTPGAQLMLERRKTIAKANKKKETAMTLADAELIAGTRGMKGVERGGMEEADDLMDVDEEDSGEPADVEMAGEDDLAAVFELPKKKERRADDFRDSEFYMSHYQDSAATDKGYSLKDGQSFIEQARGATMDLTTDEGIVSRVQRASQLTWDKKKKKFIKGDGTGSDNKKLIKTESGARLPASFKSGRFDEWKEKKRISLPKVGEAEGDLATRAGRGDDKKYRHTKVVQAKPLDPRSTTYEKKMYIAKKKAEAASADAGGELTGGKKGGKWAGKGGVGGAKSELRSVEDIRKQRKILEQRRAKNARPSKGSKGKGKGKGRK